MMNRREALQSLVGLPIAASIPVTGKTKCLILTLQPGFDTDEKSLSEAKDQIRQLLAKAGCSDVDVIVLNGFDAQVING